MLSNTRLSHSFLAFAMALGAVVTTPAAAQNFGFMKETPIAKFTPEDMKIFRKAVDDMLNNGKDGDSSKWANPATEANGELQAIKSFEKQGLTCRSMKVSNAAKGLTASGTYNFCKSASTGKWTLAS